MMGFAATQPILLACHELHRCDRRPAECREIDLVQPPRRPACLAGGRHPRRHPRPPRKRGAAQRPDLHHHRHGRTRGGWGPKTDGPPPAPPNRIRFAVGGRPKPGQPTLSSRLLGEERLITGPEAGITRDAIAVPLAWPEQRFLVHDTAGLRRRSRVEAKLEKLSVADALEAIRFAEVVVLLIDAACAFEEQA